MVAVSISGHHLRVRQPACGAACGADDTYRLRLHETTLAASRINNAGGQISVLILQNLTQQLVTARLYVWSTSGVLVYATTLAVPAQGALTVPTSGIPGLAGQTGSITITHDAPYGGLVGKAVALEPTTGFSFDTPLRTKPR
jgi:hypothetical protein